MSDVKEVGIIGQKYEDRTTGKIGVLDSRDDKCKTLMMIGADGKAFSVSYSSFRSKWRKKVDAEEVTVNTTEEFVTESEPIIIEDPVSDEDAVKTFNDADLGIQIVFDGDKYSFIKESLEVMTVKQMKNDKFGIACFPDVYSLSNKFIEFAESFKCAPNKSGRDIMFAVRLPLYKIIEYATQALVELNLYGYLETE